MTERERIQQILESLPADQRLFRINSGMGWAGKVLKRDNRHIILDSPRPFKAAPEGWPDLCGWTTVEITSEMVGQKIAIFTFSEHKQPGEKYRKEQRELAALLKSMGGICEIITE